MNLEARSALWKNRYRSIAVAEPNKGSEHYTAHDTEYPFVPASPPSLLFFFSMDGPLKDDLNITMTLLAFGHKASVFCYQSMVRPFWNDFTVRQFGHFRQIL